MGEHNTPILTKQRLFFSQKYNLLTYVNQKGTVYQWNWLKKALAAKLSLKREKDMVIDCVTWIACANTMVYSVIGSKYLYACHIKQRTDADHYLSKKMKIGQKSKILDLKFSELSQVLYILFENSSEVMAYDFLSERLMNFTLGKRSETEELPSIVSFDINHGFSVIADCKGGVQLYKENAGIVKMIKFGKKAGQTPIKIVNNTQIVNTPVVAIQLVWDQAERFMKVVMAGFDNCLYIGSYDLAKGYKLKLEEKLSFGINPVDNFGLFLEAGLSRNGDLSVAEEGNFVFKVKKND